MLKTFLKDRFLVIALLGGFLFRLIPLVISLGHSERFLRPDSNDYLMLADSLVTLGSYGDGHVFRTPAYPMFLVLLGLISKSTYLVIFIQIIMDLAICLLCYKLCLKVTNNDKVSKIAFLLQCFSVVSATYSLLVLSETLFTLIFLIFLNLYYEVLEKGGSWQRTLVMAITFTVMIYVRAVASLYLIIPLFLLICRKRFKEASIFLIGVLILCSFWVMRNNSVAGYKGFSSVSSFSLYRYNACQLLAHKNDRSFTEQQRIIDEEYLKFDKHVERAAYSKKRGIEEISKSPFLYAGLHLKTSLNSLFPAFGDYLRLYGVNIGGNGTLAVANTHGYWAALKHYTGGNIILILAIIPSVVILLIQCVAIIWKACELKTMTLFELFMLLTIFYFVFVGGPAATPRFRVAVVPLVNVLTAMFIASKFKILDLLSDK